MKLEEVYEILKKSDLSDFYVLNDCEIVFIYKDDIGLSISKIEDDKQEYSYESFFNEDKSEKDNLSKYDIFLREICKIDNFLTCCNFIYQHKWAVKYNDKVIYIFNSMHVSNPSSIDFTIPFDLEIFDFEFNFIKMVNSYSSGSKYYQAEQIIDNEVIKKDSNYQNFLDK